MLYRYSVLMLFLLCFACTEDFGADSSLHPQGGKVEVVIGCVQNDTRTSLDGDGQTVRWSVGDQIAVWATDGMEYLLAAQLFDLYTYNGVYSSADFSASITPMNEGTYTYYAVYPKPSSANGTKVTYELPAMQKGGYESTCDIMSAVPVTGAALQSNPSDELMLSFRHLLHMVRIEIPAGRNLFGEPVKRLEVIFPTEVTGRVSFDVADAANTIEYSGGSRTLTLDFEGEGLTDAEGLCAYAFVHPCDLDGTVTFRAYNAAGYAAKELSTTITKTMAAGRTTPITLTIPAPRPVAYLDFKVATNNLGDDLTDIHLTPPQPTFAVPFSYDAGTTLTVSAGEGGIFRAAVYTDIMPVEELRNQQLPIAYESENALLSNKTITLPATINPTGSTAVPMNVPYLFEEDFSRLTQDFADNEDKTGVSDPAAIWFDSYGLSGWSAARVGGKAGTSVRISGRLEGAIGASAYYEGRMDSPAMTGLKASKAVKLNVSFNYTSSNDGKTPSCQYGWSVATGAINGEAGVENHIGTLTTGINLKGTYDNVSESFAFDINNATNAVRISWRASTPDGVGWGGGWFCRIYIDNVKVKIVK